MEVEQLRTRSMDLSEQVFKRYLKIARDANLGCKILHIPITGYVYSFENNYNNTLQLSLAVKYKNKFIVSPVQNNDPKEFDVFPDIIMFQYEVRHQKIVGRLPIDDVRWLLTEIFAKVQKLSEFRKRFEMLSHRTFQISYKNEYISEILFEEKLPFIHKPLKKLPKEYIKVFKETPLSDEEIEYAKKNFAMIEQTLKPYVSDSNGEEYDTDVGNIYKFDGYRYNLRIILKDMNNNSMGEEKRFVNIIEFELEDNVGEGEIYLEDLPKLIHFVTVSGDINEFKDKLTTIAHIYHDLR